MNSLDSPIKVTVLRAFQHRGSMWKAGQTLVLPQSDLLDAFVKAHVAPEQTDRANPIPSYFGNGSLKPLSTQGPEALPVPSINAMRAELKALGVPIPVNAGKAALEKLLALHKSAAQPA